MKIIINATNLVEDRPLREVERLIRLGLAHLPEVILNSKQQESLKKFIEEKKDPDFTKITYEDLDELSIFREPSIDIDVVEPIPVDKYVSFDEPKIIEIDREYEKLPEVTEANANEWKISKPKKKLFHR